MNSNVTALVLIVLAAGVYFTVTENIIAQAKDVQAKNEQYAAAIKSAAKLIDVRDQVRKDWNSIPEIDRERLVKMVPPSVDNIRLIIDMTNIARERGLSLQNIKAAAATGASGGNAQSPAPAPSTNPNSISAPTLDTVTISFSVVAPYQAFIDFMQDLEANLRLMDLTHLSLTATDTGVYNFSVQLKTYWLRQP